MTTAEEQYTETVRTVIHRIEERTTAPHTLTTILSETSDRGRQYYSITVLLRQKESTQSVCTVPDITSSGEKAEDIFRAITEGYVTPCTLQDVISDLLG